MMTIQPLTKRQREVLDFLQKFIRANGFAPSLNEIGDAMGLSAIATVHKHLKHLHERGYIRRAWNRSRGIELLAHEGCCPMCGRVLEKSANEAKVSIEIERKVGENKSAGEGAVTPTPT